MFEKIVVGEDMERRKKIVVKGVEGFFRCCEYGYTLEAWEGGWREDVHNTAEDGMMDHWTCQEKRAKNSTSTRSASKPRNGLKDHSILAIAYAPIKQKHKLPYPLQVSRVGQLPTRAAISSQLARRRDPGWAADGEVVDATVAAAHGC